MKEEGGLVDLFGPLSRDSEKYGSERKEPKCYNVYDSSTLNLNLSASKIRIEDLH